MDKMREEFEAHIKSKYDGHLVSLDKEYGFYKSDMIQHIWEGWQASRQALVVQLPPQHEVAYRAYDSVEIRYALKDAGIKWTE